MDLDELFSRLDTAIATAEGKGWGVDWNREISVNMTIVDRTNDHRSQFIARGTLGTFEEAVSAIETEIASLSDRSVARKERLDVQLADIVTEARVLLSDEEFRVRFEDITRVPREGEAPIRG